MSLDGTTILVTGGCGQIGLALTSHLLSKYPTSKIHVFDLSTPSPGSSTHDASITYHTGSITSIDTVNAIFELVKPDVVFTQRG